VSLLRIGEAPSTLAPPSSHHIARSSDLGELWNMKSFARHRLLQEPVSLADHDFGVPMSKL
jgi:hypothetical protein